MVTSKERSSSSGQSSALIGGDTHSDTVQPSTPKVSARESAVRRKKTDRHRKSSKKRSGRDDVSSVSACRSITPYKPLDDDNQAQVRRAIIRDITVVRNELKVYFNLLRDEHGSKQGLAPHKPLVDSLSRLIVDVLRPLHLAFVNEVRGSRWTNETSANKEIAEQLYAELNTEDESIKRREVLPLLKTTLSSLKDFHTSIDIIPFPTSFIYPLLPTRGRSATALRNGMHSVVGTKSEGKSNNGCHRPGHTTRHRSSRCGSMGGSSRSCVRSCNSNLYQLHCASSSFSCMTPRWYCRGGNNCCSPSTGMHSSEWPSANPIPSMEWIMNDEEDPSVTIRNTIKQEVITLRNHLKAWWHKIRDCHASFDALKEAIGSHDTDKALTALLFLRDELTNAMMYVPVRLRNPDHDALVGEGYNRIIKAFAILFQLRCLIFNFHTKYSETLSVSGSDQGADPEEVQDLQVDVLTEITGLLNELKEVPVEPQVVYLSSVEGIIIPAKSSDDDSYIDKLADKLDCLRDEIEGLRLSRNRRY